MIREMISHLDQVQEAAPAPTLLQGRLRLLKLLKVVVRWSEEGL